MSPKWDIFSENLHIARVLLIILCAACGCCSQAKDSLSAPRDLRVFVFEESPEDIVTDENYTLLKFNISWLPPEAPLSPKYYSILISSVENAENTHDDALDNVSDCPLEENIFQTTWNAEQTSIVLPENKFLSEIPELTIRPTCTYEIQVIAQPRAAGTSNTAKINFTVPNCVGKSCNCRDAYEHLPVPQVYGEVLESGEIEIRWEIAKNHSPVSSYVLSYAVPLLISKNDLPVYNISKLVQLPGNTSNYIMNIDLSTSISSPMGHAILLATEDANGCLGKPFAFSMSDEPKLEQSTKRIRNGPLYISIAVVCIVILGGLSFVCTRRCDKYKIILPSSPTAIPSLTGISDRVQWVNSILKKHNSLYIHRDNELEAPEIGVDAFEISYERLRISKELGKGQFGRVYLGYLDNDFPVAVKLSNSSTKFDELEARRQLLDEIQTMKRVGSHSHLVKLIGCCTLPDNPICVVLEYVEGGDLLCYLHQLRDTLIKKCGDSRQRGHHNDADNGTPEVRLVAPNYVKYNNSAILMCNHTVAPDDLHKVEFKKDERKILEYIRDRKEPFRKTAPPGVDFEHSLDGKTIKLNNVRYEAAGLYSCLVSSTHPIYTESSSEVKLQVIVPQTENPHITFKKDVYTVGEVLEANCTSSPAYPVPHLTWLINGKEADMTLVTTYPHRQHKRPLMSATSKLAIKVSELHAGDNGRLEIACQATIPDFLIHIKQYADIRNKTVPVDIVVEPTKASSSATLPRGLTPHDLIGILREMLNLLLNINNNEANNHNVI
ncbi:uncharacterized protein LOC107041175 isoform X2 [Diachasma alloeum]|uniref:uncharacterized protein LOC107041175 isoform X2 n=1 Tax=Diachasma alloeum TaxID=454923 RepID=UPI0007382424|nr:uncharacterized protein LOC107041175 isoform X2 [Diachasma alloeum]